MRDINEQVNGQSEQADIKIGQNMEFVVINKAKHLCEVTMKACEKMPKNHIILRRRLEGFVMDVIESVVLANETYFRNEMQYENRRALQNTALAKLTLITTFSQFCRDGIYTGALTAKQYENISVATYELRQLIGGWIKSDRKRLAKMLDK